MLFAAPTGLDALHEVFVRVATGKLPASAAAAVALSKLTAFNKPGSGVRPIAVPSFMRRLAGRALCSLCWAVSVSLGRFHFAVGVAAGTE